VVLEGLPDSFRQGATLPVAGGPYSDGSGSLHGTFQQLCNVFPGRMETLRKYLLAAMGAALLLAIAGDVSAQYGRSRDGQNRFVNVVNKSSYTMVAVYAVPSSWRRSQVDGPDLIPNDTIASGSYLGVDFDLGNGECVLDLRARGNDGRDWIERNFNVCTQRNWNLVN
jgi:hypothetical protein